MSLRILLIKIRAIIQTDNTEWILLTRIDRISSIWTTNETERVTMYVTFMGLVIYVILFF